jgi:putative membrane protein
MLETDLIFAILHHLGVFTLVGIIAAEFALLRPGVAGPLLGRLARIDRLYGASAALVVVIGILRVFYGAKGWEYYVASPSFWAKMVAFLLVGLLSIQPTIALFRWSTTLKQQPGFTPPAAELATSRKFIHAEVALLALIPIFAAAMARGY